VTIKDFTDIAQEYYPGSRRPIIRHPNRPSEDKGVPSPAGWDAKPRIYKVHGSDMELFTVGQLAQALNRRPVTIRLWERQGVIPRSTYQRNSEDPRGRRRLYSRAQVEGMAKIAAEEGILTTHQKPIASTNFTTRVVALFRELQQ
jgi:hypothetical protein